MIANVTIIDGIVVGYLTVSEYSKKYHLSSPTVRNWIEREKVKALKIGNVYYIGEDLIPPDYEKPGRKKQEKDIIEVKNNDYKTND